MLRTKALLHCTFTVANLLNAQSEGSDSEGLKCIKEQVAELRKQLHEAFQNEDELLVSVSGTYRRLTRQAVRAMRVMGRNE